LRADAGATEPRTWGPAAALTGYIVAFSFAYERIGASLGALLLFGSVQLTMMGWGLWRGDRPHWTDWIGLALAVSGLVTLLLPGLSAPDPLGAALMTIAGASWGIYSLLGRGVRDPLAVTTGAFGRALAAGLVVSVLTRDRAHVSTHGFLLAALSGSLASGVGYTLWYAAVPAMTAWRAGLLQLLVPGLTAAGAVVLLGERLTWRLVGAGATLLVGVSLPMAWRAVFRPTSRGNPS
jgi:drug/metabolite transporter (DMT)-like permease